MATQDNYIRTALRVPPELHAKLHEAAKAANRTFNAEIVERLEASFSGQLPTRDSIVTRLNVMLDLYNAGRVGKRLSASHLAEKLGHTDSSTVENWMAGSAAPSFKDAESVANLLGFDPEWLKHGENHPYFVEYIRLPEDPFAAAKWLTSWEENSSDTLKTLYLVRKNDEIGKFLIVKESSQGRFKIFYTPCHISLSIGAGGTAMLCSLFVTLELLYRKYFARLDIRSYLPQPIEVDQLLNGYKNPGEIFSSIPSSTWWEDIWDKKMQSSNKYWSDWPELCNSINESLQHKEWLLKDLEKIRSN